MSVQPVCACRYHQDIKSDIAKYSVEIVQWGKHIATAKPSSMDAICSLVEQVRHQRCLSNLCYLYLLYQVLKSARSGYLSILPAIPSCLLKQCMLLTRHTGLPSMRLQSIVIGKTAICLLDVVACFHSLPACRRMHSCSSCLMSVQCSRRWATGQTPSAYKPLQPCSTSGAYHSLAYCVALLFPLPVAYVCCMCAQAGCIMISFKNLGGKGIGTCITLQPSWRTTP